MRHMRTMTADLRLYRNKAREDGDTQWPSMINDGETLDFISEHIVGIMKAESRTNSRTVLQRDTQFPVCHRTNTQLFTHTHEPTGGLSFISM